MSTERKIRYVPVVSYYDAGDKAPYRYTKINISESKGLSKMSVVGFYEGPKLWYEEEVGEAEVRGDGASWQRVLGLDRSHYWRVTGHNKGDHSQPNELIYPANDARYQLGNNSNNGSMAVSNDGYFPGRVPDVSFNGLKARMRVQVAKNNRA